MCGIFGFYLNRALNDGDIQIGVRGTSLLRHRGPDATGHWFNKEEGIFLGHTRLSIIDVSSASNQPMVSDDAALIYNGELYNYKELRKALMAQGMIFKTEGDTEVMLQAWRCWHKQSLERFDGMFSFAVYQNKRLHLAVDPFGEKPLYWIENKSGFYFSSEPAPLIELLGLQKELSDGGLWSFLTLGYLPSPETAYSHLFRCAPASYMAVHSGNIEEKALYWRLPQPQPCTGRITSISEKQLDVIQEALILSVRSRVIADVPLGIFLSGGIDSPLICAIAKNELKLNLQAFTVSFPQQQGYDETQRASAIAQYLGVRHIVVNSKNDAALPTAMTLFDIYGELNDNMTAIPARQMSALARPYMKVALSGIGGDEMFYGYNRYQTIHRLRFLLGMPLKMRNALSVFLNGIFGSMRPMKKISNMLWADDVHRLFAVLNTHTYRWLSNLPVGDGAGEMLGADTFFDLTTACRYFDLRYTMPDSYIPAIERASMRQGLEVRTPFLNRNLFSLLHTFDQRALVAFGQKSILRRLLQRYLPKRFFNYPKRGFRYPALDFLTANGPQVPLIARISADAVQHAWSKRGNKGWQSLAVRLVMLSKFLEP